MAMIDDFLEVYPEFAPLYPEPIDDTSFLIVVDKVECLYPEFSPLSLCTNLYPFFMLVAHTLVSEGRTVSIGILPQSGLVSSSSVGGVSVGFQQAPYGEDSFSYALSLTKYGKEYLAWVARQSGLMYVN